MRTCRNSLLAMVSLVLTLPAFPAFAGGREGEQYVPVIVFIVLTTLIALVVTTGGGIVLGAVRAKRNEASILKGAALGALKGIGAFVVLAVGAWMLLNVVGAVWIAFAYLATYGAGWPGPSAAAP